MLGGSEASESTNQLTGSESGTLVPGVEYWIAFTALVNTEALGGTVSPGTDRSVRLRS
jgi:hypothetical protein